MGFAKSVVWVTGASSGIGEALARGFVRDGAHVILSGRRIDALEQLADQIGGNTLILPFEATAYEALPAVVARAWGWCGRVDVLINNAGVSQRGLALDTAFSVYQRIMEVDFFGPLRLTQCLLPLMIERQQGQIAIVSSLAGKIGAPLRSGYSAAKHACVGYFEALRAEIEQAHGIGISTILPGPVRTSVARNALSADGSIHGASDPYIENGLSADEAAAAILSGLANGDREIYVGQAIDLDFLALRSRDPATFFDLLAAEGGRLAAVNAGLGSGARLEPGRIVVPPGRGRAQEQRLTVAGRALPDFFNMLKSLGPRHRWPRPH